MELIESAPSKDASTERTQPKANPDDDLDRWPGGNKAVRLDEPVETASTKRLRRLERAALKRSINRKRAKDVSARIYQHARKRGAQSFLD